MSAPRRLRFPLFARLGIVGVMAILASLLVPTVAQADTTIGFLPPSPQPCTGGYDMVQVSATGANYAVPAGGGRITAWSIQAATGSGPVGLEVWRPSGAQYTLVGSSPLATLTGTAINNFTLATPITVLQGDLLGLRVGGSVSCGESTSNIGDKYGWIQEATTASTVTMTVSSFFQLNVSATLTTASSGGGGNPPPPPPPPTTPSKPQDCKNGGWQHFVDANGKPFKNQGACLKFVRVALRDLDDGSSQDGSRPDGSAEDTHRGGEGQGHNKAELEFAD